MAVMSLSSLLKQKGCETDLDTETTNSLEWHGKRTWICYLPTVTPESIGSLAGSRSLVVTLGKVNVGSPLRDNITIFDLESRSVIGEESEVSDLLREFFRKRGIRFVNSHWRYKHKEGVSL